MVYNKSESEGGSEKGALPLERVRQEMDRWFDAARSTGERALESLGLLGAGRSSAPAVDIIEFSDEIVVLIDLPGVAAEAVELSLTGNMLTIKASRSGPVFSDTSNPRIHLAERANPRFERAIPLPSSVNPDDIRAETRDGLLSVRLVKTVASPSRSIPVVRGASRSDGQ